MANEINIDSLAIEIKTNSASASFGLDRLAKSLDTLSASIRGFGTLTKISKQLENFAAVAAKINPANFNALVNTIQRASGLTMPNFTKTANSLSKLTTSINQLGNIGDLENFQNQINQIVTAVRPLETLGKNTLAPFISSLRAIPKITNSIDTSTLDRFRNLIRDIVNSLAPLTTQVTNAQRGLVALNGILQATTRQNGNNAASNAALVRSYTSLGSIFSSVKVKIAAYLVIARRLGRVLGSALAESNAYVENLNLFTVAMGDAADEAFRFAQEVNNALGIDTSEFIRNEGIFKQITSGFGVITEKANLMAKNLTQIGYDISSFFNINIDEAMQKVQSGISGELEPLNVAA